MKMKTFSSQSRVKAHGGNTFIERAKPYQTIKMPKANQGQLIKFRCLPCKMLFHSAGELKRHNICVHPNIVLTVKNMKN